MYRVDNVSAVPTFECSEFCTLQPTPGRNLLPASIELSMSTKGLVGRKGGVNRGCLDLPSSVHISNMAYLMVIIDTTAALHRCCLD